MLLCSRFLLLFLMATSKVAAACLCRVVRLCYCGAPSHSLCLNFLSLPVPYGPDIRPSLSPSSQSIGSPRRAAACECRSEPKTGRSLPTSALTEVPWRVAVTCHPSQCCCCTSNFKVAQAPSFVSPSPLAISEPMYRCRWTDVSLYARVRVLVCMSQPRSPYVHVNAICRSSLSNYSTGIVSIPKTNWL